jgi:hypothetical protein
MPQAGTSVQSIWDTAYPLKVYNSMTRTKVSARAREHARMHADYAHTQMKSHLTFSPPLRSPPASNPSPPQTTFVPMNGKRVLWYMCGPTVYDAAHMGHAR